ncbi:MAG: hypothetical protein FJ109_16745 [Deltaproteobacteria bacterium]|nr:hypothetical protein [Deltaproteobacteria bacterium]
MMRSVYGKRTVFLALGLVGCLAFAAVAWAATSAYFLAASGTWTEVSGVKHALHKQFAPNSTKEGVSEFVFFEKTDDPVSIRVGTRKLCDNDCKAGDSHNLQVRDADPGFLTLPQLWYAAADEDHYVTAIQVCLNGRDDLSKAKIKGLKVWSARIDDSGKLVYDNSPNKEELNNCKEWSNKVSCPDGRIATGVRAHYISDSKGFAGLALYCSNYKKQ